VRATVGVVTAPPGNASQSTWSPAASFTGQPPDHLSHPDRVGEPFTSWIISNVHDGATLP
jgi:hypothetical protein